MKKWMWLGLALVAAGCGRSGSMFDYRYVPDRAEFGRNPIPVSITPPPHVDLINSDPVGSGVPQVVEEVAGTWTFTAPPTVTQMERRAEGYKQFLLYHGRPAPTDTPFVVVTVSRDPRGIAESDPQTYQVTGTREYALNGNVAREWVGTTKAGQGFCELFIRRPGGKGEVCHAIATVKSAAEQKEALGILGSLVWQAAAGGPTEMAPAQ